MDLDGAGRIDILSGSYSRMDKDMAGLIQVLYGNKDGTFRKAEVLKGTDGNPLIIPTQGEAQLKLKAAPLPVPPVIARFEGVAVKDVAGNETLVMPPVVS